MATPTPSQPSTQSHPSAQQHLTDPCVHCGFCLSTCASYRILGAETDSPRGRIHFLKAVEADELNLADVADHFDSCLGCYACVTACPSGVRYDQLIAQVRPQLNDLQVRSPWQRLLRQALFALLPYPGRLRRLLAPMRCYGGSWLQTMARRSGLTRLFGPEISAMEALLPPLSAASFRDGFPLVTPAQGPRRARVGLVLGCVQRLFEPEVNAAVVRVLTANGVEVVIPPRQGCCGAVTDHQGETAHTQALARDLVAAFAGVAGVGKPAGAEPLDAVLVAASGCGHTLKHYHRILETDTPWAKAGRPFAQGVKDLQEFLAELGLSAPLQPLAPQPLKAVVHDPCHMLHGQGIAAAPRQLLAAIPGLTLASPLDAGVCCGSAGIYNIVQPEIAAQLGEEKCADLTATGAQFCVSANIGCTLQLRQGFAAGAVGAPLPVLHPAQVLDCSIRGVGLSQVGNGLGSPVIAGRYGRLLSRA